MAERLNIRVNQQGARIVQKDIQNIGSAALRTGGNVDILSRSLKGLGAAFVIRGIIRTADAFTLVQNRLKVVTDGTAELNAVTEELLDVSTRTRTSFEANAELFQRFAAATERLGLAQGELLRIVESINQAVTISGVTSVEAAQALRQLAQGIGSSELRGQELRSVLEQLPKVADVIAQQFGVTRGELLKLGEAGKIGAVEVLKAFQNARPELARAFAEIVPTVGQALTVLKNEFTKFVGDLNKSTGIITGLSRSLLFLADNFDIVGRIVLAVGILLSSTFAARAVPKAILAIKAFNLALLSNPFTAVAVILTTLIALIISFADKIKIASGSMVTIADVAVLAWERVKGAIAVVVEFFNDNFGFISEFAREVFKDIEFSVEGLAKFVAKIIDTNVGLVRGLFNVVELLAGKLVEFFRVPLNAVLAVIENVINNIISGFGKFVDRTAAVLNKLIDAANKIPGVVIPAIQALSSAAGIDIPQIAAVGIEALKGLGREVQESFLEGFESGAGAQVAVDRFFDEVKARATSRAALVGETANLEAGLVDFSETGRNAVQQQALDDVLDGLQAQAKILGLINFERGVQNDLIKIQAALGRKNVNLTNEEKVNIRNLLETNELRKEQGKLLQSIDGNVDDLARRLENLNAVYENGVKNVAAYNQEVRDTKRALNEAQQTITGGFENAFLDLTDSAVNFADITSDLLTSAFGAAEDAFVDFVKTGEFQFDKLVESILEDLARLAFRQAIFGLLAGAGAGGGFGSSGVGTFGNFLTGRQHGGPVGAGQAVVVGERRPEIFVPTQSGNILPQAAAAAPEVNVNVVNVTDPEEISAEMSSPRGERTIINVVRRNRTTLRSVLGF